MKYFKLWFYAHHKYLLTMYEQMLDDMNYYKVKQHSNISFKDFVVFVYNHSSQRISEYE